MAKVPTRQIVTIVTTLGLLIAILILKQQCGRATAQLFDAISKVPDGGHDQGP
jgi:hypothetical protein